MGGNKNGRWDSEKNSEWSWEQQVWCHQEAWHHTVDTNGWFNTQKKKKTSGKLFLLVKTKTQNYSLEAHTSKTQISDAVSQLWHWAIVGKAQCYSLLTHKTSWCPHNNIYCIYCYTLLRPGLRPGPGVRSVYHESFALPRPDVFSKGHSGLSSEISCVCLRWGEVFMLTKCTSEEKKSRNSVPIQAKCSVSFRIFHEKISQYSWGFFYASLFYFF